MPRTDDATLREIIALRKLSVGELRARWLELFGEETKSRNRNYLFKRLAYRIQEQRYGDEGGACARRGARGEGADPATASGRRRGGTGPRSEAA